MKDKSQKSNAEILDNSERALGRVVARPVTEQELEQVSAAAGKGYTDSGSGLSADCDVSQISMH